MKTDYLKFLMPVTLFLLLLVNTGNGQTVNFYDLKANKTNGEPFDFSELKGKKVLIINTSTGCTLAPQFKKLQEIYLKYHDTGFEILAFPSNDYGKQEQDNNLAIRKICDEKYKITFLLMEKISIRENPHPVFRWLTSKEENGFKNIKVLWNFQKFLIDENGKLVDFVKPITSPSTEKITLWIEGKPLKK